MLFQDEEQGLTRAHIEAHRENHESLAFDCHAKHTSPSARLNLIVVGSGSKGNASVVYDRVTGEGILIDAGICKRDVFAFSAEGGFDMAKLKGILISHNHSDHVKNLGVILRGLRARDIEVPLYLHPETLAASKELKQAQDSSEIVFFEAGQKHTIGALDVSILPTSHDAPASFAFKFECGADALGFITDTGVVLPEALEGLRGVRILGLESNHDEQMLKTGPYPRMLKERVGSEVGHLSNAQAADALAALMHSGLETVVALHISENNNTYRLPVETLRGVVARAEEEVSVVCAYQKRPVFIIG